MAEERVRNSHITDILPIEKAEVNEWFIRD